MVQIVILIFRAAPEGIIPLVPGERRHSRDVSFRRIKTRIFQDCPVSRASLGSGRYVRTSASDIIGANAFSFEHHLFGFELEGEWAL